MVILPKNNLKILLLLLKDFSKMHTISSIAKELRLSRVGVWKSLQKLKSDNLILIKPVGIGKTSTSIIALNKENIIINKILELSLLEEAILQKRWRTNFIELEKKVSFLILFGSILHSPKEANDIDLIGIISQKNKFTQIQKIVDKIQKTLNKKIHLINFTEAEFKSELLNSNPAFLEAVKKGIILFGQDKFIQFIEGINQNGKHK